MCNPPTLTLTKESGESLTLMKGDEGVELLEEGADPNLFILGGKSKLTHSKPFARNFEKRRTRSLLLSELFYFISHRIYEIDIRIIVNYKRLKTLICTC